MVVGVSVCSVIWRQRSEKEAVPGNWREAHHLVCMYRGRLYCTYQVMLEKGVLYCTVVEKEVKRKYAWEFIFD